ncbi:MAG: hypothetical protein JWL84_2359 [Rhodospirillales bacterium]|nr:hypothetical protein [Rhodospirillales bacterium]
MGDIVEAPERGLFTGNRGILHDAQTRTLLKRRWASRIWLICTLHWRDVRRTIMGPGSWTELFFLDEATGLAAGHRPCFLCRREAAEAFQAGFPINGHVMTPKAPDIDRVLHTERLDGSRKRLHDLTSSAADLPNGAMILQDGAPPDPDRSGPSLVASRLWRRRGAPRWRPPHHSAIHRRSAAGRLSAIDTR